MDFEWDAGKNERNLRKHGISFELASQVFSDPLHVSVQDRVVGGEARWQTLGRVRGHLLLLVAHLITDENDNEVIRIISAREAEPKERRRYE